MPHALIEVRREYPPEQEEALIEAVHAALRVAFRIPASDRHVRLLVHAPHRFAVPPQSTRPDRATIVTIDAFAGRSLEAKRELYGQIVERLGRLGIPPEEVSVLLREHPRSNWGIRGGQAACDVDLGFEVEV